MRTTRSLRFAFPAALAALVVLAGPRPAAAAEDYVVKGSRPSTVGQTYRSDVTYTEDKAITVRVGGGDGQVQKSKTTVTLVGDVKVLEVTDKGEEKKVSVKVVSLKAAEGDGESKAVVPEGTTLVVSHDGTKQVVTKEGGDALDAEAAELVNHVVNVDDPSTPDDDDAFNPKDRKKVGDSWAFDKDKLVETFAKKGAPVDKQTVAGKMTLVEVKKVGDVESMVLRGEVSAALTKGGAMKDLPPGMAVDAGTFTMSIDTVAPVDATKNTTGAALKVEADITLSGPAPEGGGKLTVNVKTTNRLEAKATYK